MDELRREIDQRVIAQHQPGTMDVDAILRAAAAITHDMSPEEICRMVEAMNDEFIEDVHNVVQIQLDAALLGQPPLSDIIIDERHNGE